MELASKICPHLSVTLRICWKNSYRNIEFTSAVRRENIRQIFSKHNLNFCVYENTSLPSSLIWHPVLEISLLNNGRINIFVGPAFTYSPFVQWYIYCNISQTLTHDLKPFYLSVKCVSLHLLKNFLPLYENLFLLQFPQLSGPSSLSFLQLSSSFHIALGFPETLVPLVCIVTSLGVHFNLFLKCICANFSFF